MLTSQIRNVNYATKTRNMSYTYTTIFTQKTGAPKPLIILVLKLEQNMFSKE